MNQEKVLIAQLELLNTNLTGGITVNEPDLTDIKTNTSDTAANTATIEESVHLTSSLVDGYLPGTTKCIVMAGAQLDTKFAPITLSNSGYIQNDIVKIQGTACEVNSGNNSAGVQRVCLATNDLNTAYLRTNNVILSGSQGNHAVCTRDTASTLKCGFGIGLQRQDFSLTQGKHVFVATGSGNISADPTYTNPGGSEDLAHGCPRVCIATDDVNLSSINTWTGVLAACVDQVNDHIEVDTNAINGVTMAVNSGNNSAGVQRVCIATDDINLAAIKADIGTINTNIATMNTNLANIYTILNDVWNDANNYIRTHETA